MPLTLAPLQLNLKVMFAVEGDVLKHHQTFNIAEKRQSPIYVNFNTSF